jgi:endonuclease/exonuclease/phosphatase (EEP) superfamily protein YafD
VRTVWFRRGSPSGGASRPGRIARYGRFWFWIDAFGIAVNTVFVLWCFLDDTFQLVVVFGYIAHLALPAAFIWLPLAIVRRRRISIALEAVSLVAFVWLFGNGVIRSDPAPPPAGAAEIVVLTYNLGNGLATPEKLIPMLRSSGADVIGLEEVTPETEAAMTTGLADLYPYQALYGMGIPGKGLLSRYPIVRNELLELNPGRPDLRAIVDFNGMQITIIVAHPPPPRLRWTGIQPREGTAEQVDELIDIIKETKGPLIVLGDFNVTPLHDTYRRLEDADLRDVFRLVGDGLGYTMPTRFASLAESGSPLGDIPLPPVLRIDYVWISRDWYPVDAWIAEKAGSDHRPVEARLAIQHGVATPEVVT